MAVKSSMEMKRPSTAAREPVLIAVDIGETKTRYTVHRSLLAEHSEYFKKALSGSWKEAEEGLVTLKDVDCQTFNIFVDWVYTQKIPKDSAAWSGGLPKGAAMYCEAQSARINALVFGDRVLSPIFRQAVCKSLVTDIMRHRLIYKTVVYAFANVPVDHPILELMVYRHCQLFGDGADEELVEDFELRSQLSNNFLVRVMLRCSQCEDHIWDEDEVDLCYYHGHAGEEERKQCQGML